MARIVFMGTPDFAVASAQTLFEAGHEIVAVVTVPDKKAGRGNNLHESAMKVWAKEHKIPVHQPIDLSAESFIEQLKACQADLFIVVAFRILPRPVFTIPPRGTINLHGSLLPAYRGAAPINWAIINGESVTGVTTFLIDAKVDTGEMLLQEKIPIGENENFGELYDRMKVIGARLLLTTVEKWMQKEIESERQDGDVTKAPKITQETCEIIWYKSAKQIQNLVRGLAPIPTAFTWYKQKRLKIYQCEVLDGRAEKAPGTIITADAKNGVLAVATRAGLLHLTEVQLEGKNVYLWLIFSEAIKLNQGKGLALHKNNTRLLAVELLSTNEIEGDYINHLIEKSRGFQQLSPLDRALCLEIVYGVLRNKRHLDAVIKNYITRGYASFSSQLKNILRTAFYQLLFLEKIPDYAVLSESVEIAKRTVSLRYARLVNGVLRNFQRNPYRLEKPKDDNLSALAEYYSHPEWLVKQFARQFGKNELQAFLIANNQTQSVYVRRLKDMKMTDAFSEFLEPVADFPRYFEVKSHSALQNIPGWKDGAFCVQDPGSGMAIELLAPQAGETIVDLCAAPGGKTMAISALVGEKGHVVAVESVKKRLNILEENTAKTGFENVKSILADAREFKTQPADAVLIDAPCSGLGVMARRADLRWQRKPYDLKPLVQLQKEILANAATLVKPGGRLVYSTCTIDKSENEEVIADFLEKNSHFTIEKATEFIDKKYVTNNGFVRTWPHKHAIDGSFSARLRRNNN